MVMLDELLPTTQLPALCLFKDTVGSPLLLPNFPFDSCAWMKTGRSLSELRKQIPRPALPTDSEKVALLRQHRVDEGTGYFENGKFVREPNLPQFDDSGQHFLSAATDQEIFGASYTILVVTPPDLEVAVSYLLKLMVARRGKRNALTLFRAWNDYVDRLAFYPITEDASELRLAIIDTLEERLQKLPKGWSKGDFEMMDEWFMK